MKKLKIVLLTIGLFAVLSSGNVFAEEEYSSQPSEDYYKDSQVINASDIQFYKTQAGTPIKTRKKGLVEHKEAIALVKKYLNENKKILTVDIDNPEFQQFAKSLSYFYPTTSKEDFDKIDSFAKFIDLYENFEKNKQLKEYKEKLNKGGSLSQIESEELSQLLPIPADAPSTANFTKSDSIDQTEFTIMAAGANGYDLIKARDYAYDWWNKRNPIYDYYASYENCRISDPNCWDLWNDCANFVSQALYNGGMKMRYGSNYQSNASWSYSSVKPSNTWGGALNFYWHWKDRAGIAPSVSALQTGDVVSGDTYGDADVDHTAIITRNIGSSSSLKYVTQHTWDHKEERSLADWYSKGPVYAYEMDKASN